MKFNFNDLEPLLTTLARLFASTGDARQVALLAEGSATIEQTDSNNWNGETIDVYTFFLRVPHYLFSQIEEEREKVEEALCEKIRFVLRPDMDDWCVKNVVISPELSTAPDWRKKAKAWTEGRGVTNQGRVRSDNIANKSCDGLLFRSQPEIFLYKAFKSLGVSFAPLPVFVRGGEDYQRIEPDFVVIKDGITMIVEVDGDTVHQETPVEAHARRTMLVHEGAILERVKASQCETLEEAKECANQLLKILKKQKENKR